MPGIVGLQTKMPREWAEPQLLRMVEALQHESFYVAGTWVDESDWNLRRMGRTEKLLFRWHAAAERSGRRHTNFFRRRVPGAGDGQRLKAKGHRPIPEHPRISCISPRLIPTFLPA